MVIFNSYVKLPEGSLCWKRSNMALPCWLFPLGRIIDPSGWMHIYKSKMSQYGISQYIPILGFIMGLWSKPRLWNIYSIHRNLYGFLRIKFDPKPPSFLCLFRECREWRRFWDSEVVVAETSFTALLSEATRSNGVLWAVSRCIWCSMILNPDTVCAECMLYNVI